MSKENPYEAPESDIDDKILYKQKERLRSIMDAVYILGVPSTGGVALFSTCASVYSCIEKPDLDGLSIPPEIQPYAPLVFAGISVLSWTACVRCVIGSKMLK